ncbi:undecaprenyl-diphosphate phosphatase [Streptomyces sp. NPDC050617]|uniref:undecaprenyl-diphosphate phosphatase n=1 Tax=Streptomyces sp. NPDC050617 TaxID=3154628 RepID=UPI00341CE9CB
MNLLHAAAFGAVRGLTEFLPVSSSAHLRIASALTGWPAPGGAFAAATQLGAEAAVLVYFRRDLGAMARAWGRSLVRPAARADPGARLGWSIAVGSVPIAVLGPALHDTIAPAFHDLRLVALGLIALGVLLAIADHWARGDRAAPEPRWRDTVLIGLAQTLALLPGASRTGGSLAAALFAGFGRVAAVRYSLLLAVPAVLGSGAYGLVRGAAAHSGGYAPGAVATALFAAAVAGAVGYAALTWFMRFIAAHTFGGFMVYRTAAGFLLLALLAAGSLPVTA